MPKGIFKRSPETCLKISQRMKGNKINLGRRWKMSDAGIQNLKKCRIGKFKGEKSGHWKGGKSINHCGYVYVYSPNHPYKNKKNYVFEHRLVMEKHLGRHLLPSEIVHHINGIKNDNHIENLMLFSSKANHVKYHAENDYHQGCVFNV